MRTVRPSLVPLVLTLASATAAGLLVAQSGCSSTSAPDGTTSSTDGGTSAVANDSGTPSPPSGTSSDGGAQTTPDAGDAGNASGADGGPGHETCAQLDGGSCSPTAFSLRGASYGIPGNSSTGVAVGDINGDCLDDIVAGADTLDEATDPEPGIAVYLSNGDGTFAAATDYPFEKYSASGFGNSPFNVAVADLNGDGRDDAIGYPSLGYILNLGGGTFGPMVPVAVNIPAIAPANFLLAADVDGDGLGDLLLGGGSDTASNPVFEVAVLRNSGGSMPSFAETDYPLASNNGHSLDGMVVSDVNGDGKPDVVTSDSAGGQIQVLINQGGTFAKVASYPLLPSNAMAMVANGGSLAAGDVDGDGKPDLAFVYPAPSDSAVVVFRNKGDGTFASAASYTVNGNHADGIVAADLNGDGKADLATIDTDGNTGSLLMNAGDGTFGSASTLPVPAMFQSPFQIAAGNFRGSGPRGLAVTTSSGVVTFVGKCP